MLSRKYYVLIAKAIKSNTELTDCNKIDKEAVINDLCREFKRDNSLFSADRFVDACE